METLDVQFEFLVRHQIAVHNHARNCVTCNSPLLAGLRETVCKTDLCKVINALLYVATSGGAWQLPKDFLPFSAAAACERKLLLVNNSPTSAKKIDELSRQLKLITNEPEVPTGGSVRAPD